MVPEYADFCNFGPKTSHAAWNMGPKSAIALLLDIYLKMGWFDFELGGEVWSDYTGNPFPITIGSKFGDKGSGRGVFGKTWLGI